MKKTISVLTAMLLIVAFSAGAVFAANGYGSINFTEKLFQKDVCKTTITIQLDGSYRCKYFIGAEVWQGNTMVNSGTEGWTTSYADVDHESVAPTGEGDKGYGLYVGMNEYDSVVTYGCGWDYRG